MNVQRRKMACSGLTGTGLLLVVIGMSTGCARADYHTGSGSSGLVPDPDYAGPSQTTITTCPDGHMIVTQGDAGTDITIQRFSDTGEGEAAEAYRERMFERLRGYGQR